MPEDISSSSSREDEDPEPTERRHRFQCPADFVPFSYKPCSSTLSSSSTELWLIKAPASFSPQSFSGIQLPLHGLEMVNVPSRDGTERSYSILGSSSRCPELRLLTMPVSLSPPFSGLISICESHCDPSADRSLQVVPAFPPPSLPPGLKHRFQHFQTTEREVSRKRKREGKIKTEPQDGERAKALQPEVVIKTEVKHEPLDTGFGEQLEARKKKKKKKKSKSAE